MSYRTIFSLACAVLVSCARPASGDRPGVTSDLVVGEFSVKRVVDGDTIWVDGLDASLRLLGIDTEETFKTEADRRAYAAGWPAYAIGKRGDGMRPAKYATPLGEDAKTFAAQFFAAADRVRLERDDVAEIRDRYGRYLAYVFAHKDGAWQLYNVECVRAGMAPYFTKYGRSRRFDADFVAAEAEAKAAHRGIWAANAQAYPDYPEREAWWAARADFVARFRADAAGHDDHIDITHEDALAQLEARAGTEVTVLGTVGDLRAGATGPIRVNLSRRALEDLALVIFDRDVFDQTGLAHWNGEYVTVRGRPTMVRGSHDSRKQAQIVVDHANQVVLSPLPGLTAPTSRP